MKRILRTFLALGLVVATLQPTPAVANHCPTVGLGAFAQMSPGQTKTWGSFPDDASTSGNTAGDHVPNWWSASDNYSSGCGRNISSDGDIVRQSISAGANNVGNGDVSLYKSFAATGSHSYKATADANIWNFEGTEFRAALKISAWGTVNGEWKQLKEWKTWICPSLSTHTSCDVADNGQYQRLTLGPKDMPAGTEVVKVAFRANGNLNDANGNPKNAYGTAGLTRLSFSRTN